MRKRFYASKTKVNICLLYNALKSDRYISIPISREKIMELGTPLGLAFASGINAYLPLLSFAISARVFHLFIVNPYVAFITQDWFVIALVLLTLADFVADKFPIIDHSWDAVHTVIRPLMGALVATASSGQFHLPGTSLSVASSHSMLGTVVATTNGIPVVGLGLLVILLLGGVL